MNLRLRTAPAEIGIQAALILFVELTPFSIASLIRKILTVA